MNLYTSDANIKTLLGISGSAQDAKVKLYHRAMTRRINQLLNVTDLSLHLVTGERVDALAPSSFRDDVGQFIDVNDINVVDVLEVFDIVQDKQYLQDDPFDVDNYRIRLEGSVSAGVRTASVDYVAGWDAYARATIVVSDVANLAIHATVTVGHITPESSDAVLTRGTAWTGQSTDEDEATAIAAAITACGLGVRAFAGGATVYVIETTAPGELSAYRTLATSDSVRLAKSAATVASVDFPDDIVLAIVNLVAAQIAKGRSMGVKTYRIGQKTVEFAADGDAEAFQSLIAPYMRGYVA